MSTSLIGGAAGKIMIAGASKSGLEALGALTVAAMLAGWAPGASAADAQSAAEVSPESTTQLKLFAGAPRVAISTHGNLLRFEGPTGYDHIGVGEFSEGYVLCYGAVNAYDTGSAKSGFGPSSTSCGTTCTVTRNTSDGKLQLKQVISRSTSLRSATFEMTLSNLTGGPITGVILRRQADLDVDTGGAKGTNNFNNWFGASERDSVFGWNPINASATAEGHAISLVAVEPTRAFAKVTSSILDSSCNPANIAAAGPVQGDHGVTLQYNIGTLPAGGTVKNTVKYLRN